MSGPLDFIAAAGFPRFAVTHPARSLNTDFQPHATKPVLVIYSVSIHCEASINVINFATRAGRIELRSDAAATPTTVQCAARNLHGATGTVSVSVSIVLTNESGGILAFLVPPGHNVRLATVIEQGTAGPVAFTLDRVTEIILG